MFNCDKLICIYCYMDESYKLYKSFIEDLEYEKTIKRKYHLE
jgi:hypothetical protein